MSATKRRLVAMKRLIGTLAVLVSCATPSVVRSAAPTTLVVEQRTTLHVGELVVLHVPSDRRYSPDDMNGAWHDVLARVRRSGRDVTFRAVRTGSGVVILSPQVRDGACISCATLHYFVDVVPRN